MLNIKWCNSESISRGSKTRAEQEKTETTKSQGHASTEIENVEAPEYEFTVSGKHSSVHYSIPCWFMMIDSWTEECYNGKVLHWRYCKELWKLSLWYLMCHGCFHMQVISWCSSNKNASVNFTLWHSGLIGELFLNMPPSSLLWHRSFRIRPESCTAPWNACWWVEVSNVFWEGAGNLFSLLSCPWNCIWS